MLPTLNNPAGLWALLGIPAVLLIHFLQRQSREVPISTLFLLDQLQRENLSGRRFERLKSSIPLWLQLLMVLLVTWLLVQPRWMEKNSVQRIVVVMDGSASMQASREAVISSLKSELNRLGSVVQTTEFFVLDTLLEEENLYHGTSLDDLMATLKNWEPVIGSHDRTPALRLGRSLASRDGLLVFVTDHAEKNLPFAAKCLAVGKPAANVGFAGFALEEKDGQLLWKAVLKNYGTLAQTRNWWTEMGPTKTAPQSVALEPGQAVPLQGLFPADSDGLTLRTDADSFALDDSLPALKPKPKTLSLMLPEVEAKFEDFYKKLLSSLPDVSLTVDAAATQVPVVHYDPANPAIPSDKAAIVFLQDAREKLPALTADIIVEAHPLMAGLNWQSLLCLDSMKIPMLKEDEPILWQGERCLIFLRGRGANRQLCFNFDVTKSNARKLPGLVILLHRYLETVRDRLPLPMVENYECGQKLVLAAETGEKSPDLSMEWLEKGKAQTKTVPLSRISLLQAPRVPGIFKVKQGETTLLQGSASFADTREADLSKCAQQNDLVGASTGAVEKFSKEDHHWRLWMLGLLGTALLSWRYLGKRDEGA